MRCIPTTPIKLRNGYSLDFTDLIRKCNGQSVIPVILELRNATGLGLKDCKEAIDPPCMIPAVYPNTVRTVDTGKVIDTFCKMLTQVYGVMPELNVIDTMDQFQTAVQKSFKDWQGYGFKNPLDFVEIIVINYKRGLEPQ